MRDLALEIKVLKEMIEERESLAFLDEQVQYVGWLKIKHRDKRTFTSAPKVIK